MIRFDERSPRPSFLAAVPATRLATFAAAAVRWRIVGLISALVAVCVIASGCGGAGYADDNAALADRLFAANASLEVVGSTNTTYCSTDSCRFSDDRVATIYQVVVTTSIDDVVAAFYAAYPGFDIYHDACATPDCDGTYVISASQGSQSVYLSVQNNMSGTLTADAQAPDLVPTTSE